MNWNDSAIHSDEIWPAPTVASDDLGDTQEEVDNQQISK